MALSVEPSRVYPQSLEYLVSLHFKEEYKELRLAARELKTAGADEPTRALGEFFYEHAEAYLRWLVSYEYEAIREREETAWKALAGKRDCFPGPDSGAVIFALEALSMLVIEGTQIENGMIASDPRPMYEHSKKLKGTLDDAYEWLSHREDAHHAFLAELEWRRKLNDGTNEYAELLTHFPYDKEYFLSKVTEVEQDLDSILNEFLGDHFETCSDLRAHKEFLRHYRAYLEPPTKTYTPYFRNTHISWLLNFQIDRKLAGWLCDQLTPPSEEDADEGSERLREHLEAAAQARFLQIWHAVGTEKPEEKQEQQQGKKRGKKQQPMKEHQEQQQQQEKLQPIKYIQPADSQDYLETGFGEHDMRACILTFRPLETHLDSLVDVAADGAEEQEPDQIEMALKIYAYGICTLEFSIDELDLDIFQLRQISTLIAPFAHKASYASVEDQQEGEADHATNHSESQLDPYADSVFNGLKATVQAYIEATLGSLEKEIIKEKGQTKLTAEAKKHHRKLRGQLRKLKDLRAHAEDKNNWIYAPHLNWYTYANPRQMMLATLSKTDAGEKTLLPIQLGDIDIASLPEYKGLVLPLREKRASLHDWLAVRMPNKRNLAEITSHIDDLFFVSNHSALIYFPDDPNFNVQQFIDLVETAARLQCLVTSMVSRAKLEFDDLARLEETVSEAIDELGKRGIRARERLLKKISNRQAASEHFDSDARRSLDLLTLRVVSQYVDTTKLMQAMAEELEIDNLRQLFDQTMDRVNMKRVNLLEQVKRLQNDKVQEQTVRFQTATGVAATLLAAAGIDAIITDIGAVLADLNHPISPEWHLGITLAIIAALALFLYLRYGRGLNNLTKDMKQEDERYEEEQDQE